MKEAWIPTRTKSRKPGRIGRGEGRLIIGRRALLGVLAAVGAAGWLPPPALGADSILWTNSSSGEVRIGNLDGTGSPQSLFTGQTTASGGAINPVTGKLYWGAGPGEIQVGNLDGTGAKTLIPGQNTPIDVAIDPAGGKVYWTNYNISQIMGANLDGTGIKVLFGELTTTAGLAIDPAAGKIYWDGFTNPGNAPAIRFGNIDGSGSAQTLYTGPGVTSPVGLAIDHAAGKIYWSNQAISGQVEVANLAGTTPVPVPLYTGESYPEGLAVDPAAGKIYWATNSAIRIGNLNGNGSPTNVFGGESGPDRPALLRSPAGAGAPQISGGSSGAPLSCSQGAWASDLVGAYLYRAPQSFSYQWTLRGADIGGATGSSYSPTSGGSYACRVTATNFAGATAQTSGPHRSSVPRPASRFR